MRIETERLAVRSFREDDAEALYGIKTDPEVMKYCPDLLDVDLQPEDVPKHIRKFDRIEETGNIDAWRCYAIEEKETGRVIGCLTTCKQPMLHEYELGWMILSEYTKKGYASEAAEAYAEYFCGKYGIDYIIAVMDVDNPASRRTAEKCGFRLFEKRTVYDVSLSRYCDDYYYLRRYYSGSAIENRFYGDVPYYGRQLPDTQAEETKTQ